MKQIFLSKYYNILLEDIYNRTLKKNGFTPAGVCWNSTKSQYNRFKIIVRLLSNFSFKNLKLADVGCGYGEFLVFLKEENIDLVYEGYDINKSMIEYCKKRFIYRKFFIKNYPINICDLSIMSGTYNYAVTENINSWENYIIYNLKQCYKKSKFGIIFNLQFSKNRLIKNSIYYTEISFMLNLLKYHFIHVDKFYTNVLKNDVFFIIYKN